MPGQCALRTKYKAINLNRKNKAKVTSCFKIKYIELERIFKFLT